jgi:hypothetical protein
MKLCLDVDRPERVFLDIDWSRERLCIAERPPGPHLRWKLRLAGATFEGENMKVTLTDVQGVDAAISAVDAKGNPAALDGVPVWTPSDPAVTVTPSPDGLTARIDAVGPLGNFQVTVTADADLGEGVTELAGILDVEVVASEAVSLTFAVGTPTPNA